MERIRLIRYFIYCRKSSEREDRQVQSIETQERELSELAQKMGFEIVDVFKESKSAFRPGRDEFEHMLKRIRKGEADGILVLHPNRISRNSIDGAVVIDLIDNGYLTEVRTPGKEYRNTAADKMMLALEFMMSKKDSDDKSEFVKKGMKTKAIKGYPHGLAKVGYLNDKSEEKGNRKWLKDELRFPLVQRIFRLFLSGNYSVKQLCDIAEHELHLTTLQRKKEGGKPIALSYWYVIFADPIYAGFFYSGEERHELNESLERVISEEEFWRIQGMLGKKGRPKPQKRTALYNHFMRCRDCGGATTPDFKFQIICSDCRKKFSCLNAEECPGCGRAIEDMKNPTYLTYVYYYCVSRKKNQTCTKGGVLESKLEAKLLADIEQNLQISSELSKWCVQNVRELQDSELEATFAAARAREVDEHTIQSKLKNLLDLRISRDDWSQEEVASMSQKDVDLRAKWKDIKEKAKRQPTGLNWKQKATKDFCLMTEVLDIVENGTFEEKKTVLAEIGSNLTFSGKELSISYAPEINVFVEVLKAARLENARFEPRFSLADKDETEVFASVRPALLALADDFRRIDWVKEYPVPGLTLKQLEVLV